MLLRSSLQQVLVLHYAVSPESLRPALGPSLQLKTFEDNQAAFSVLIFRHARLRWGLLPFLRRSFWQMNCRTYAVDGEGVVGVYFFRMAIPAGLAAAGRALGVDYATLKLKERVGPDDPTIRVRSGTCDGEYWRVECRPERLAPACDALAGEILRPQTGYLKTERSLLMFRVRHAVPETRGCRVLRVLLPASFNPAGLSSEKLREPAAAWWIDQWEFEIEFPPKSIADCALRIAH